jgi:hypothetical protein
VPADDAGRFGRAIPAATSALTTDVTDNRRDDRRGAPSHDTRPGSEQPSSEQEDDGHGEVLAQPM